MLKPTFVNILVYIVVKWIAFYFVLFRIFAYYNDVVLSGFRDFANLLLFDILMGGLPVFIELLLFSLPMYFSFVLKKRIAFIVINMALFTLDYFLYIWGTSQLYFRDVNGIYLLICGVTIFMIFYFRAIVNILCRSQRRDK